MSSSKKKTTKQCCRNCKHYVLGYTQTTQTKPIMVCNKHEKRIYRGDYNGVKGRVYYYSARPMFVCDDFSSRLEEENDG